MNKKFIIPLVTAVAAVTAVGVAVFRNRSKYDPRSTYFAPNKLSASGLLGAGVKTPTFQTDGKQLRDPCGSPIILKGVNKQSVFDHDDPVGASYFPEIAKSGANCVRIVWEIKSGEVDNPLTRLDQLITNAKANKLIPIVGLWDFTETDDGGFSHLLTDYVSFWIRPDVVKLIKKHQAYLIVNIANEAAKAAEHGGNEDAPTDVITYANAYKRAVNSLRQAGINVPLMIDGMDRGKSLKCFALKGPEMLNADPRHNLIFSFHAYWSQSDTDASPTFIQDRFAEVSGLPINIVIGELAGFGAWPGSPTINVCSPAGKVDYLQFAQRAETAGMGWLMWEWGPGGRWQVPGDCPQLNMTTNGTFKSIMDITSASPNQWVRDLAIDLPFSLKHAQKTAFITNGFKTCPRP